MNAIVNHTTILERSTRATACVGTITVQIKSNYGRLQAYPINDNGQLFAQITGTKTLSHRVLEIAVALGYRVEAVGAPNWFDVE